MLFPTLWCLLTSKEFCIVACMSLLWPGTTQCSSFPRALPCVIAACQQGRKKRDCEWWGWAAWVDWRPVRKVSRDMQVWIFFWGELWCWLFLFCFCSLAFKITHRGGCRGDKNKREHLGFGKVTRTCFEERETLADEWLSLHLFAMFFHWFSLSFHFFATFFLLLCRFGEK